MKTFIVSNIPIPKELLFCVIHHIASSQLACDKASIKPKKALYSHPFSLYNIMKNITIVLLLALLSAAALAHKPFGIASVVTQLPRGGANNKKPQKKLPTRIVVAVFNEQDKADQAADVLKEAASADNIFFRNLAVIHKDYANAVKLYEYGDSTAEYSARVAMVLGALALTVLGPTGTLMGGAGGALVGYAGEALVREKFQRESDAILNQDRYLEFGHILKHGTSALVAVFEEVELKNRRMRNVNMKKYILWELEKKLRRALKKGKDVAFVVSVDESGICAVQMVRNKKALYIKKLIKTKRGRSVGRATAPEEEIEVESSRVGRAAFPGGLIDAKLLRETIGDVVSDDDEL